MDKELRILIFEEVPADAELEEHELRKAGLVFTSKVVDTKETFLKALDEFSPDLILSDYDLPSFDGLAALRIAKEKHPDVPFILVTWQRGEEFAIEKIKEGATDYVLNGNLKRLGPSVKRALEEAKLRTERKNIQDEIFKTKERLGFIINTAPVALYTIPVAFYTSKVSGDYGATFISGGITGLLGHKPEDFISNPSFWADNIHPHDRERVFQELPNILKHGYHVHEYRFRHADGTYHWMHDESKLIYDKNGNPFETIGCWLDITERKQAEEALRESEIRYKTLFSEALDGICLADPETGVIIDCNKAMEALVGRDMVELIGQHQSILHPPAGGKKGFSPTFEQHMADKHGQVLQTQVITKTGEIREVEIKANLMHLADGKVLQGVFSDITKRKRIEEEKAKLEDRLLQAHKMKAVGTLAGGVAHDFNNLLMGILGYTSLMLMKTDKSHPFYDKLKIIERQVQRGADLTRKLLGFAHGGKYEVKPVNANDLIIKTSEEFGRAEKEITIQTKLQEDLHTVEVDGGQIEQVLLNLYMNACHAMPSGGELYLETKNVVLNEEDCRPFDAKPGPYVEISVTDTGVGMDADTRQRIFEPFFTTKDMERGTGLGLASAYAVIKNHGGIIDVYSEKGHGSTFSLYLPASEKEILA